MREGQTRTSLTIEIMILAIMQRAQLLSINIQIFDIALGLENRKLLLRNSQTIRKEYHLVIKKLLLNMKSRNSHQKPILALLKL